MKISDMYLEVIIKVFKVLKDRFDKELETPIKCKMKVLEIKPHKTNHR